MVDPALVTGVLGDGIAFVPDPRDDDLAVAVGAIVRADATVDAGLGRMPRLRVVARTGVGTDRVDLAATARAASRSSSPPAAARVPSPRASSPTHSTW